MDYFSNVQNSRQPQCRNPSLNKTIKKSVAETEIDMKALLLIAVRRAFPHDIATGLSFQQLQHFPMTVWGAASSYIPPVTTAIHWGNWNLMGISCLHRAYSNLA
jgi:hypothetical protein